MRACVCVMVKNEQHIIAEWLSYHFALGFDAAVVLDNGSTDDTLPIVRQAARAFDIRTADVADGGPWTQPNAYVAACRAFDREFDWMAFLDADEFLAPTRDAGVKDLLARLDAHHAVALNWKMFGSAGHDAQPPGLVVEAFRRCAPPGFGPNRHVKSLVRPANVAGPLNPHVFKVQRPYVDALGRPVGWAELPGVTSAFISDADWFVHHYFVQSRAQWAAKVARGYPDGTVRKEADFPLYDRNEVLNEDALRFAAKTRASLARFAVAEVA